MHSAQAAVTFCDEARENATKLVFTGAKMQLSNIAISYSRRLLATVTVTNVEGVKINILLYVVS